MMDTLSLAASVLELAERVAAGPENFAASIAYSSAAIEAAPALARAVQELQALIVEWVDASDGYTESAVACNEFQCAPDLETRRAAFHTAVARKNAARKALRAAAAQGHG